MYLSELIKKPVRDSTGKKIGKLTDVLVSPACSYPVLKAITVDTLDKKIVNIPETHLYDLEKEIRLKSTLNDIRGYEIKKSDIRLREDVLDHQVVDIENKKVKRVNDIRLSLCSGFYHVIGVDIGFYGILKRFHVAGVAKPLGITPDDNIIAWKDIDTLNPDHYNLKLKECEKEIKKLHHADISEIVEQLSVNDSLTIFNSLDEETAADTLEHISPERQVSILEDMNNSHRAAKILGDMNPEHAADVLSDLSEEKAEELLDLMETEKSEDLRKLLKYPKNSAGGIMTTAYAHVDQNLTGGEVIEYLREIAKNVKPLYYVYVTSKNGELVGVASLREILLADPDQKITEFMNTLVIKADILDDQDDVAQKIAKYKLQALPVVEDDSILRGIITLDDVINIISPDLWKRKVPIIFGN